MNPADFAINSYSSNFSPHKNSSLSKGCAKAKSVNANKKYYAIKHIIPTSHPSRIYMELKCLKLMGGKDNIIEATLCLRNLNHIVLIMPYFSHDVFNEYVGKLTVQEICDYIYNLLKALEKVHSYNIVHRDIKPSNFLYSRKHRRYALIDFGLAQDFNKEKNENGIRSNEEKKFVSPASETPHVFGAKPVKRKLSTAYNSGSTTPVNVELGISSIKKARLTSPATSDSQISASNSKVKDSPSKHTRLALSVRSEKNSSKVENSKLKGGELPIQCKRSLALQTNILRRSPRKLENVNRIKFLKVSSSGSWTKSFENSVGASISGYSCSGNYNSDIMNNNTKGSTLQEVKTKSGRTLLCPTSCRCYGSAKVCSICLGRKSQHAPRAGTPGFRAPEVLLRHPNQTTALDIWSAGVILLCLASSRCSFFRPVDDISSLAEITTVFGTKTMKKIAANLEKLFTCSEETPPLDLRLICEKSRANSSVKLDTDVRKLNDNCCERLQARHFGLYLLSG
ncbi:Cell division cycle 7-related protein kinase [Armadillidium vulgare]|nr:Cell division cycle 7-related protein kinase [Armadillidium vulgare]